MDKRGFTLIEVLAVLGIISILSSIAVPRFYDIREEALVSTMKGDLHQLRFAQEAYRVEPDGVYAESLDELGDTFRTSEEVEVSITDAGSDHWAAEASHPATSITCEYSTDENLIQCGEEEEDSGKK